MDQETGLLATIRDTPPLEGGTRKARSVLDCQQKKKRGWPIVEPCSGVQIGTFEADKISVCLTDTRIQRGTA